MEGQVKVNKILLILGILYYKSPHNIMVMVSGGSDETGWKQGLFKVQLFSLPYGFGTSEVDACCCCLVVLCPR